ncbi:hypothetical protein QF043_001471 [Pseudomonas sp. W3I7]|uniref:bacteriocin immunity protein n=1 Tax=Pseudomonas sp. W3I7 TaxID=3042292 RepID=UPI002791EA4A|nr:bacteriocin immunity protein [Pseudomonas sp. W3I7]MDQ0702679.1 hypothetical protein [Pseudomonas sp. W3I7]
MEFKNALGDCTEQEFEALIRSIEDAGTEEARGELVEHFNSVVPHPEGSNLLFYPKEGADDSPSGVAQSIKAYCFSKGLPCFKDA